MKYDPQKHHRRSIRLKGYDYASPGSYFITLCVHQRECLFGEIVDGEMQLSELGEIVRSHWIKLPQYHLHLRVDAFVVMPNHLHGILVLTDNSVGAGLIDSQSVSTPKSMAKPAPTKCRGISEILRGFKTFSARRINRIRKIKGMPVWQRDYYERIIRDDKAFDVIQTYIRNNPLVWEQDQLHPDNPSKW